MLLKPPPPRDGPSSAGDFSWPGVMRQLGWPAEHRGWEADSGVIRPSFLESRLGAATGKRVGRRLHGPMDESGRWRTSCRCYREALKLAVLFASQFWMVAKYVGANRCNDAISALLPVFASSWR